MQRPTAPSAGTMASHKVRKVSTVSMAMGMLACTNSLFSTEIHTLTLNTPTHTPALRSPYPPPTPKSNNVNLSAPNWVKSSTNALNEPIRFNGCYLPEALRIASDEEKKLCTRLQSTRVTLSFLVVGSIWWWPYTHTHTSAFLVAFWRYHKNKIANTRFFISIRMVSSAKSAFDWNGSFCIQFISCLSHTHTQIPIIRIKTQQKLAPFTRFRMWNCIWAGKNVCRIKFQLPQIFTSIHFRCASLSEIPFIDRNSLFFSQIRFFFFIDSHIQISSSMMYIHTSCNQNHYWLWLLRQGKTNQRVPLIKMQPIENVYGYTFTFN